MIFVAVLYALFCLCRDTHAGYCFVTHPIKMSTQKKLISITVKDKSKSRAMRGHPWLYNGEQEGEPCSDYDGQAVILRDSRGRVNGTGLYNSRSKIIWRRFTRSVVDFDEGYLQAALKNAITRRGEEKFCRLVWSEVDCLPGLIVDRYGDVLVVQALTLGVDQRMPAILHILRHLVAPSEIVVRNDAPIRTLEGLGKANYTLSGKAINPGWYSIRGMEYFLDFTTGHKTGFYLDQRDQHIKVGGLAAGRTVLDAFCNQGAFGLHCAANEAASVLCIDSSAECVEAVAQNAARNKLVSVTAECANVFDWFKDQRSRTFDLIILDPPSFARNRGVVRNALRGYKELNLRALRMLSPGGILATYSCSQHVTAELFRETVRSAAADSGRDARVVEETSQPSDHPVWINFPESLYLKGLVLEVDN